MNHLVLALVQVALFACFHIANAQSIVADNNIPPNVPSGDNRIELFVTRNSGRALDLANLTSGAVSRLASEGANLRGSPLFVDANTVTSNSRLTSSNIAFIQCDSSAYPGYIKAYDVVQSALQRNPQGVILYSNSSDYCRLESPDDTLSGSPIYTMTNYNAWNIVENAMGAPNQWAIARRAVAQNSSQIMQNGSPGGPSPSTAVAMIILYSITGVITALFLVIIITGAIRAHRHPERYGPRNVLGRPRQSRARGLARAMLDTLPIVKFGEKDETAKPGDVELAPGSTTGTETREAEDGTRAVGPEHANDGTSRTEETDASAGAEAGHRDITAAGAAVTQVPHEPAHAADEDNSLGCSICTEDFERGQDVRVLPCNHSFHPACIDPWLLNVSGTCPLCRIDLRPAADRPQSDNLSPSSTTTQLPPPLEGTEPSDVAQNNRASRRLSGFWEILNPRRMEEASPQERIAALRRVQEQRRAGSNPAEELENRRRRRLTARLGETFGVRTRAREPSPSSIEEHPAPENVESSTTTADATSSTNGPRLAT